MVDRSTPLTDNIDGLSQPGDSQGLDPQPSKGSKKQRHGNDSNEIAAKRKKRSHKTGKRASHKTRQNRPSPPDHNTNARENKALEHNSAHAPHARNLRPWGGRRAYAAIDLGTNNCRLLIAKPARDGFVVVDAFSRVVRLGEGLAERGRLGQNAMDRAVAALGVCADKLKRRNVCLARSVATEACRRASNGQKFIERVRAETGIALDIISAEEEARLAVLGCHILLEPGQGPALIFDIGGGSTELVLVDTDGVAPEILDWISIPWGVVSLTESEPRPADDRQARAESYARMRRRARESFAPFEKRLPDSLDAGRRLLGTSGTVTTLASLHLSLPCYNRSAIDGLIVPSDSMRTISQRLAHMSVAQRAQEPCIGRERAELVVAGCAILEAILDIWPAARLGVADRGIREGILRSLMANDGLMAGDGQQTPNAAHNISGRG